MGKDKDKHKKCKKCDHDKCKCKCKHKKCKDCGHDKCQCKSNQNQTVDQSVEINVN